MTTAIAAAAPIASPLERVQEKRKGWLRRRLGPLLAVTVVGVSITLKIVLPDPAPGAENFVGTWIDATVTRSSYVIAKNQTGVFVTQIFAQQRVRDWSANVAHDRIHFGTCSLDHVSDAVLSGFCVDGTTKVPLRLER